MPKAETTMRGSGINWLCCLTGAGSQFHINELQPHQRRVAGNKRTLALILILCKLPKGWLTPLPALPLALFTAPAKWPKTVPRRRQGTKKKHNNLASKICKCPTGSSHPRWRCCCCCRLRRLTTIFGHSAWQTTKADPAIPEWTTLHYCCIPGTAGLQSFWLLSANLLSTWRGQQKFAVVEHNRRMRELEHVKLVRLGRETMLSDFDVRTFFNGTSRYSLIELAFQVELK